MVGTVVHPQRTSCTAVASVKVLENPKRLIHAGYAALLLCAAIAVTFSTIAKVERPAPTAWSAITVSESGTLWAIAQAHPVPGLSTADTVALIKESNLLDSAIIMPGQTLRVPAQTQPSIAVASR